MHPEPSEQRTPERWNNRYEAGDLPWDSGQPDHNLIAVLADFQGPVGHALEIGCGTGTNAIVLAKHGFNPVTATDIAPRAIELAREKAEAANVRIDFHAHDFLSDAPIPGLSPAAVDFIFDRGVFHSVTDADRHRFAQRVAELLSPNGWWLNLSGNADDRTPEGPPRLTAGHIAEVVEPFFEIHALTREAFRDVAADESSTYLNWRVFMRKRVSV